MFSKKLLVITFAAIIINGCGIGYRKAHKPEKFPPADPTPHKLPISRYGNPSSYEVFGETYTLLPTNEGYTERGVASWYGKKFHGRRASSGETYNMYAMTAAHKTLPIPVYAQVTNLENGRKVIVKINDRGPFVKNRLIDLSYAAATKLGVIEKGTAPVEVTTIIPSTHVQTKKPIKTAEINKDIQRNKDGKVPTKKPQKTVKRKENSGKANQTAERAKPALPFTSGTIAKTSTTATTPKTPTPSKPTSAQNIAYFLQIGAFGDKNNAVRLIDRVKIHLNEKFSIETISRDGSKIHKVKIGPIKTIEKADLLTEELEGFEIGAPKLIIAN